LSHGKNLSEGSVPKQLLLFALPFVFSSIVQNLYSAVDLIILGQFAGTISLAGANISAQYISLITNIAIGFCLGGTVIIGQYRGGGNDEKLRKVIGTLVAFIIILAMASTVLSLVFAKGILNMMKTPAEAMEEALIYFNVCSVGFVFIFGYNTLSAILRGMGDSNRPFIFICISSVVNIVLDLVFIAGFKMGALGAALATVIAQAVSMLLCIFHLRKTNFVFDFRPRSIRIDKEQFPILLRTSIPTTIQNAVNTLAFLLLTIMVNTMGVTAAAALAGAHKVTLFAILPSVSFGSAISAMCAQNFGADKPERAMSTMHWGFILTMGINVVIFALVELFPVPLMKLFGSDMEMMDLGVRYLRICSIDYLLVPFMGSLMGFLVGSGHTIFPMFLNCSSSLLFRLPVAYVLGIALNMGLDGIAWGTPAASFCVGVISIVYYASGKCHKVTKVTK